MKRLLFLVLLTLIDFGFVIAQSKKLYDQELPETDLKIAMVPIPKGTFTMGSPEHEEGRNSDEGPQRNIELDGFWMSSHEITWDLYHLFLQRSLDGVEHANKGQEVSIQPDAVAGATIPYVDMSLGMGSGENLPVGNVTQLGASKFCEWLSAITGNFYRLPTEAEWEYAARAGSTGPYFFESNDVLEEYAWFNENSEETYHEVGGKKPNAWGLYDIYGNVAEWTLDQYIPDTYKNEKTEFIAVKKEYPVAVRGGSYKDVPTALRSASRKASKPVWKQRDPQFPKSKWWHTDAPFVGFRIVRPYKTPDSKEQHKYWLGRE